MPQVFVATTPSSPFPTSATAGACSAPNLLSLSLSLCWIQWTHLHLTQFGVVCVAKPATLSPSSPLPLPPHTYYFSLLSGARIFIHSFSHFTFTRFAAICVKMWFFTWLFNYAAMVKQAQHSQSVSPGRQAVRQANNNVERYKQNTPTWALYCACKQAETVAFCRNVPRNEPEAKQKS